MDKNNQKKGKGSNSKKPFYLKKFRKPQQTNKPIISKKKVLENYVFEKETSIVNGTSPLKLNIVERYLSPLSENALLMIQRKKFFKIDVNALTSDNFFSSHWPNFLNDLVNTPQNVIDLFELAMVNVMKKRGIYDQTKLQENSKIQPPPKKINARFFGLKNYLQLKDVKTQFYGKFVAIKGSVVRSNDVKPFCTHMAFECLRCKSIQLIEQENGTYTLPKQCIGNECNYPTFKPLFSSLTQTIPVKTIRLQELNENIKEGRVPRSIECELKYDLVETCLPGDVVIVSGILNANNKKKNPHNNEASTFTFNIDANSITNLKGKNGDNDITLEVMSNHLEDIKSLIHSGNLFRLIVNSLCPSIYGHEIIKAGLILCLFGGTNKNQFDDDDKIAIRGNSHILIVGDPGLGKSQMLLACSNVSCRGTYVCGGSTTTSGLTITLSKENGENCLDAGALVLSDQGHCCIDEFDKMSHQHSALLEAMEQQTISIAKSGVVCTFPARTSIIAAANPSGGHYNKAKTVSENLRIGPALLSRFDLVFIIKDCPDYELDNKMTEHVILHQKKPDLQTKISQSTSLSNNQSTNLFHENKLLKQLQFNKNENLSYMPHHVMQKYIAYARKYIHPKLTPEVCKILKNFYCELRKQNALNNTTFITTRQLESLIRLTQARARLELRNTCLASDAEDVIEIMKYSMIDTFSDEFGNIDCERSIHGSGMSKSSKVKKLVHLLTQHALTKADDCFTLQEINQIAKNYNIQTSSLNALIETLNFQGFLIKKGYQFYQIQTL